MTDQTAGHTCGSLSLPTYSGEVVRCVLATGHERQCQSATEYPYVSWPNPSNIEQPDAEDGEQCGKWGGCILNPGHTGPHRHTPRPVVVKPQDHPGADLYVRLRRAGEDHDTAQALIYAHARMAVREHQALNNKPAAGLDASQPATDQARPPRVQWRVELQDVDGWVLSGSACQDYDEAVTYLTARKDRNPDLKLRLVRETTTWTVEETDQ